MATDRFEVETVRVIDTCLTHIPPEVNEEICEEQANDSYLRVYLKPAVGGVESCTHHQVKTREWLASHGIKWNGKDDYEYILFYM